MSVLARRAGVAADDQLPRAGSRLRPRLRAEKARGHRLDVALSNAMGLGGHNGCVLLGRDGLVKSRAARGSSVIEPSTTSASASASSPGGKCGFGIANTRMPAAFAERIPLWESSTAAQRDGSTSRRRAASR